MRSPWLIALVNPLNLFMLCVVGVAALVSAWWMLPVGLLIWFVMVLTVALEPSLRINQAIQERQPLSQRFQAPFGRIEKTQVSLYNTLSQNNQAVRNAFQPLQAAFAKITNDAYQFCQRMVPLENYLVVAQSSSALEQEYKKLDEQQAASNDPVNQKEFENSKKVIASRIEKLNESSKQLERMDVLLQGIGTELEGILSEVIRLQALDPRSIRKEVPGLVARVEQEASQLKGLE